MDVGADLVLCHHPHVYGPILTYNGKYIVGSLGNFCFGGNYIPKDKDTQISSRRSSSTRTEPSRMAAST